MLTNNRMEAERDEAKDKLPQIVESELFHQHLRFHQTFFREDHVTAAFDTLEEVQDFFSCIRRQYVSKEFFDSVE